MAARIDPRNHPDIVEDALFSVDYKTLLSARLVNSHMRVLADNVLASNSTMMLARGAEAPKLYTDKRFWEDTNKARLVPGACAWSSDESRARAVRHVKELIFRNIEDSGYELLNSFLTHIRFVPKIYIREGHRPPRRGLRLPPTDVLEIDMGDVCLCQDPLEDSADWQEQLWIQPMATKIVLAIFMGRCQICAEVYRMKFNLDWLFMHPLFRNLQIHCHDAKQVKYQFRQPSDVRHPKLTINIHSGATNASDAQSAFARLFKLPADQVVMLNEDDEGIWRSP